MRAGEVVNMTSCEIVSEDGDLRLRYRAPKGRRFVFLVLGDEPKDGSAPLNCQAVLERMGWQKNPAAWNDAPGSEATEA
ncbi:hypothetical protein phiCbK_187 [Caulobacter phage phiCbK]|uniref:Uncharacterized protein n=5 Tax=Viruses TaxID=10239 RepID=J3SKZ3_9CAUD|nr:hypothetical protein D865_gp285 [Caulobacter phage phiCbK]AFO71702.1 hypothetical protein phiCbK_187 [Caulobacter phage phiCbK]AFU86965.1 hypothetical protein CbK_gp133 [Caulobacter phage phiCbK]